MICTKESCGGGLRVTHTYTLDRWKFQRATCLRCGRVHRLTTTAAPVKARGEGAKAHAARAMEKQ